MKIWRCVVVRKSYDGDIAFKIYRLLKKKNGEEILLSVKGLNIRIESRLLRRRFRACTSG